MKKISRLTLMMIIAFILPSSIMAQKEKAQKKTEEGYTHEGFFLRFQLGSASEPFTGKAADSSQTADNTSRNPAAFVSSQVGISVAPNLALHAGFNLISVPNIEVSFESDNEVSFENETGLITSDQGYDIFALSLGLSYYFAYNFYISPEYHSIATLRISDLTQGTWLGAGIGYGLTVGKEWWVDKYWGLGIALSLHSHYLSGSEFKIGGKTVNLTSGSTSFYYAVLFSATYY